MGADDDPSMHAAFVDDRYFHPPPVNGTSYSEEDWVSEHSVAAYTRAKVLVGVCHTAYVQALSSQAPSI